jgi:hypothetical protein
MCPSLEESTLETFRNDTEGGAKFLFEQRASSGSRKAVGNQMGVVTPFKGEV